MAPIEAAEDVADAGAMADVALENAQDHAKLHGCLAGLESRERSALRGAFFDGNTYEDLATRMNVPLGTMKSWIRRAMMKLKSCLQQ
jgi:RNA polymerase sigma factor (sigma-70 family)